MKNLFIIVTGIAFASASFANTDAYYIKTVGDKFVCVDGDAARLCDEDKKTAFTMENIGGQVALKALDGSYIVALAKTDACENNSGEVKMVMGSEDGRMFQLECQSGVGGECAKVALKSIQYKTYIRANLMTGVLDQVDVAQDWEKFGFEPATVLVVKAPVQPKPQAPAKPAVVTAPAGSSDVAVLAAAGLMGAVTLVAMKLCPLSGMGKNR